MTGRAEVGQGGAHPHAVHIVHRHQADAGMFRAVHIIGDAMAGFEAGGVEHRLNFRPVAVVVAAGDGQRPVGAVKIILDLAVGFNPAVIGQHIEVRPLRGAPLHPQIEILRQPPQEHLPVDRAAAADNLALRHMGQALLLGQNAPQGPVMPRFRRLGGPGMPQTDVVGQVFRVGIIRPGLQQQHRDLRVFRQPRRRHRPGGTAADYDIVVFHRPSPLRF